MSSSAVVIVFLHTSGLMTIVDVAPLLVGACIVSMSAASSLWGRPLVHECETEVSVRAPRRHFGFTVATPGVSLSAHVACRVVDDLFPGAQQFVECAVGVVAHM